MSAFALFPASLTHARNRSCGISVLSGALLSIRLDVCALVHLIILYIFCAPGDHIAIVVLLGFAENNNDTEAERPPTADFVIL